jgi:hypothetical protein
MPLFATDDGLILTGERSSCRARAGALNYLFRDSTEARVRADYLRSRDFVRSVIVPRSQRLSGCTFVSNALEDLIQEITLHWMYFYIVNSFKVAVSSGDIAHPQTRRVIRKHVERIFGSSAEAIQVGSVLFGVSADHYKKGIEGDDYLDEIR